jgi:hypothetical protein
VPTILLAILWQSHRLKKFVNVMHQTFLDQCRDICVSSQIDDFHILVHAVFICCIYCTISFNSAVKCHGAPKMLKCHVCHEDFHGMLNSFGNHVTDNEIFSSPVVPNCRKFPKNFGHVTATLGCCRNQNFGRPVTCHGPCQIE